MTSFGTPTRFPFLNEILFFPHISLKVSISLIGKTFSAILGLPCIKKKLFFHQLRVFICPTTFYFNSITNLRGWSTQIRTKISCGLYFSRNLQNSDRILFGLSVYATQKIYFRKLREEIGFENP